MSVERITVEYPGNDSGTGVSGPVTTGSVSTDPLTPDPGGTNELDTVIAALNPTLDYDASETGGTHFNLGSAGSLNVAADPQFSSNDPWLQAPGCVRGAPATYSFLPAHAQVTAAWASTTATPANLPAVTGWATGTFNCFIIRFSVNKGDDWSVFALTYRASTSLSAGNAVRFQVNENGRLFFLIGAVNSGAVAANQIRIETGDGVIQLGNSYMITANQPGDGGGIDLYVNGVEQAVTRSVGASQDADSFVDALADSGNTLNGPLVINGYANGVVAGYSYAENAQGMIQRPTVWRNNGGLTPQQITDLHAAGSLTSTPSDYYEFLLANYIATQDAAFCQVGWLNGADTTEFGPIDTGGGLGRMNWNPARLQTNVLETQRISRWPNYRSRFDAPFVGGQYISSGNASILTSDTVATVSILVTHNTSVPIGQTYPIWGYGEGISGPDENVGLAFAGNTFGTSIVYTIGQFNQSGTPTGNFYRETVSAADADLTLAELPKFTMVTLVQDGVSGIQIYVDSTARNTTVSSGGVTFDEDSWFAAITPSPQNMSIGYSGSTAHVGSLDIHHHIYLRNRALSAAEVGELWDAVSGVF